MSENRETLPDSKTDAPTPAPAPAAGDEGGKPRRYLSTKQLIIMAAVLALGVIFTITTSSVTGTAEPGIVQVSEYQEFYPEVLKLWKPLAPPIAETLEVKVPTLPSEIGSWRGVATEVTPAERKILPPDTGFARRIYTNDRGHQVYCSLVLEGTDVTSIHRPEVCLQGQGWRLASAPELEVSIPDSGTMKISRIIGSRERDNVRQEVLFGYWFVGTDRVTSSHFGRIISTTFERLIFSRNQRWAYFLLMTPVPQPSGSETFEENRAKADELMKLFVREVFPSVCKISIKD